MIIGKTFGDYRILSQTLLGESGLVYKAFHLQRRQTYFLKILAGVLAEENPLQRAFLEKLDLAASLDDPRIARVYSREIWAESSVIPLEFVHGQPLSTRIKGGQSPFDFVLRIALQAAEGLSRAHQAGLVHGRLTSNCLLVTQEGDLKILDFAMSYLPEELELSSPMEAPSQRQPTLSRMAYLPPEQIRGGSPDARSDLYSLGAILFEVLTGEFLFPEDRIEELQRQIMERPLPRLGQVRHDTPASWSKLLRALLNRNPAERYPSAESLLNDLDKIRNGYSLEQPHFMPKNRPMSRRSFFLRFLGDKEEGEGVN